MKSLLFFAILVVGGLCQKSEETDSKEDVPSNGNATTSGRTNRMFSFLQVLKFPNDACAATNGRNGTCYTSDECLGKSGTASGTCANGFGVCCFFSMSCGSSTSENNTYFIQSATTAPTPNVCVYTICRSAPTICRIRLDFTIFVINGPVAGTARTSAAALPSTYGGAIGDCASDTFTFNAPNNRGSPIICGINTGQHMYIDASSTCAKATFDFGSTTTTRQYDIKLTQYSCGDEMGGPSDCLQYFTATTGTVSSFNFKSG
jgi:hypothetical protein